MTATATAMLTQTEMAFATILKSEVAKTTRLAITTLTLRTATTLALMLRRVSIAMATVCRTGTTTDCVILKVAPF
jgi:hypothetical protein